MGIADVECDEQIKEWKKLLESYGEQLSEPIGVSGKNGADLASSVIDAVISHDKNNKKSSTTDKATDSSDSSESTAFDPKVCTAFYLDAVRKSREGAGILETSKSLVQYLNALLDRAHADIGTAHVAMACLLFARTMISCAPSRFPEGEILDAQQQVFQSLTQSSVTDTIARVTAPFSSDPGALIRILVGASIRLALATFVSIDKQFDKQGKKGATK